MTSPSAVTQYIQTSNYVDTDQTQTVPVALSAAPSNYVDPDVTQTIAASPASGEYVPTDRKQTVTSGGTMMAIPTSNYVGTDETTTIAYSADTSEYVPTDKTQTVSTQPTPTSTTILVTTSSASVIHIKATTSDILITSGSRTLTSHTTIRAHSSTTQVPVTETRISTGTNPHPTDGQQQDKSDNDVVLEWKWNESHVFLATYLSVVLAVLFRILISVMHNNFTLIEPFRQLMEPNGALADRAFFSFYQNQSNLYGPIPALSKGRWALALIATAYLVASTFPALAAEAIWVDTNWDCAVPLEDSKNPCPPQMTVSITVVRVLQGLLAFVGLAILFITILLLFKRTGLPANPSSIATMASLMRHPALIDDLNDMPVGPGARPSSMKASLAGKRYKLSTYKSETGSLAYGIQPLTTDLHDTHSSKGRGSYTPVENNNTSSFPSTKSHRFRWMDVLLLLLVLGTFGVVLAYYLDGNDDDFNTFFSSNTFGPRFILTGAGTVIATSWRSVEQTSVVVAPYIALSRKPSSVERTICFAPSNTPILSTWTTLRAWYWLPATVTLVTLTGEALNIVISGVPFATGQTWGQFLVSAYMSIGILGLMIIVAVVVIVQRRREPKIPVHSDTLVGKMYYLSGSRMLDDFEGCEWEKEKARDRNLRGLGKKYSFQPMIRKDGRRTWLIDEVGHEGG